MLCRQLDVDFLVADTPAGDDPQVFGRLVEARMEERRVSDHCHHALGVLLGYVPCGVDLHVG